MAPAVAADRLSALPDDLLIQILSFAPSKEAASTTLLSRRWRRPLWLETGVVNLDTGSYDWSNRGHEFFCNVFARDAKAAVWAFSTGPQALKKLTVFMTAECYYSCNFAHSHLYWAKSMLAGVLDSPAARHVEELRIGRAARISDGYGLPPNFMPFAETLRVLDLSDSTLEPASMPAPRPAFPRLTDLRLRSCAMALSDLLGMVHAAPNLASLRLESTLFCCGSPACLRLRCPAVTDLVVTDIRRRDVELDMPMLRSFRYAGRVHPDNRFSLLSPSPDLARVELELDLRVFRPMEAEANGGKLIWRFLRGVSHARVLRLCVLGEEVAFDAAEQAGDLAVFRNLQRLELQGTCWRRHNGALANLLLSCPVISELCIRLSSWQALETKKDRPLRSNVSLGQDEDPSCVADLRSSLNGRSFECLRSSIRKVVLQFEAKSPHCLDVELTKFIVENALLAEEIHIGGSESFMCHIKMNAAKWRDDSLKRRNLPTELVELKLYEM